jgi:hypothetical protein
MKETTTLRPIGDIWNELTKHPDYVVGAYYDKETVIDIIAQEIVDGDDEYLYSKAEEILNNNFYQIQKNVENCYEFATEELDFLDGCDLPEETHN